MKCIDDNCELPATFRITFIHSDSYYLCNDHNERDKKLKIKSGIENTVRRKNITIPLPYRPRSLKDIIMMQIIDHHYEKKRLEALKAMVDEMFGK